MIFNSGLLNNVFSEIVEFCEYATVVYVLIINVYMQTCPSSDFVICY